MEKECKQCKNSFPKKEKGRSPIYCESCAEERKKISINLAMKRYLEKKKLLGESQ